MSMTNLLGILARSVLLVVVAISPTQGQAQAPNVVLITVDDLGWTDLSVQGSTYYETPNIDGLAAQGIRFTNAYSAAAMCSPSRAAILTGRYPARMGITDWIRAEFQGAKIPEDRQNPTDYLSYSGWQLQHPRNALWMEHDEITIAEVLRASGYATGYIGKWHLGPKDWHPETQGFELNLGGTDIGEPPTFFDPYARENHRVPLTSRTVGEYLTDREADEAVQFIQRNRARPFFLNYAPYAVHTPIEAKPDLIARYAAKPKTNHRDPVYAAMIHSVDQAIGQIMDALDRSGIADRTIVIFTSDNGGLADSDAGWAPPTNNRPLRSGKATPFEGGIRVPLIMRWHGTIPSAIVSHETTMGIDLLPTILDALNHTLPAGREIDGVSLMDHIRSAGTRPLRPRVLYWHFPHYGKLTPYSVARSGDWKLIKWWEGPRYELYNLREDLGEAVDLASIVPDKVRELDASLTSWYSRIGARLPRANPDYRR